MLLNPSAVLGYFANSDGFYGRPHWTEYLLLRRGDGGRLEALKIVGDANVPRGPRVSDVPIKKPGMFAPERLAGITLCPSCAAPLAKDSAKQCSRCKTRYCSAFCQRAHWKKRGPGGHKTACEKIASDGGVEASYAMKMYIDALEEAITACLPDEPPAAVTCYICDSRVASSCPKQIV